MLGRGYLGYLTWFGINCPSAFFENFEMARVKREQFQNFQKSQGWFIPKIARTKHVITG